MACISSGRCSPAEPSNVYDRSKALGPTIFISHRSFACDPTIETRQSPSRSASTCSIIARTSACRPESPVCCISTETAILTENSTVFPGAAILPATPPFQAVPGFHLRSRRRRSMIGAHGGTGRSHSQTRKPQLRLLAKRNEKNNSQPISPFLAQSSWAGAEAFRGHFAEMTPSPAEPALTFVFLVVRSDGPRLQRCKRVRCSVPAPDQPTTTDTHQTNGLVSVVVR